MDKDRNTIKIKNIVCPRCGLRNRLILLREEWQCFIEFAVMGREREEQGLQCDGDPQGVRAHCVCGHSWKLVNARQVLDLDIET